ncbi:MAG TPA: acyl-CoA dehydrogenase family protein [Candidatus Bathyarchaeia archaeon]|nr:acyl-CoA dehydrogenase family protein [Candidatus Bathyarchaeia archaeon]
MDFSPSPRVEALRPALLEFMERQVYPNEARALEQIDLIAPGRAFTPVMLELRKLGRETKLWNSFLPDEKYGAGLTNWEYGMLCEIMGRSPLAPTAFNCAAPDTGNMEILAEFGSEAQKREWLQPLLDGKIRSCFSMTEPDVSSADPTQLKTRAVRDGDHYVINGHKWFTSGAVGASVAIVMAVTNPDAAPHLRASQIIVPIDTPGLNIVRSVPVMGHTGGGGHCEIRYEDCRVPATNLLGPEGGGFVIAQARLGPGRIHHCMRAIGGAERALDLMCQRANTRQAFGSPLGDKQFVQDFIATSRMEIDQARLLTLYAAWKMDTVGKKEARQEISMIKVVAANMYMHVLDRAIQVFGAAGMSDDFPIARMWRDGRSLRIADGPDEAHKQVIARRELKRWAGTAPKRLWEQ